MTRTDGLSELKRMAQADADGGWVTMMIAPKLLLSLIARVEKLEGALKPFAAGSEHENFCGCSVNDGQPWLCKYCNARTALGDTND